MKWKFDGNAETGFASSAPVQTSQILKTIWVVAAAAVHIIDAKRNIIIVEGHLMTQRSLQKL